MCHKKFSFVRILLLLVHELSSFYHSYGLCCLNVSNISAKSNFIPSNSPNYMLLREGYSGTELEVPRFTAKLGEKESYQGSIQSLAVCSCYLKYCPALDSV